jgi:hypothetical protein
MTRFVQLFHSFMRKNPLFLARLFGLTPRPLKAPKHKALKGRKMIAPGKSAQRTPPGFSSKKRPSISGEAGRLSRHSFGAAAEAKRVYQFWFRPYPYSSLVTRHLSFVFPFQKITRKRPQSRKPITRIHILLDHIKREIIKPAEAPNRNHQQHPGFQRRLLHDQQRRRENTDYQKQNSFQLNPARVSQVLHSIA